MPGRVTRCTWKGSGDSGRALRLAFQYRVGSRTYSGERVRYVFRPFRIGLGEATSSTLTWGAGKTVAVYFNSGHPEEALLDKGLTTGDWLFLTLVLAVLIAASGGIARNLTFETRPNC